MNAPHENSIQAHGLVREFKKGPRAVDGIDLHVDPGEIYGFLGPNGAGKSTTVHMLTTLLPPTAGTATVAGYDVVKEGPQVRKVIGAALQEAALDPFLTGREHLRLQTTMHGIIGEERRKRSEELLIRVGLAEAADRKVNGYSGGMKRRLDLALVHRPRVLFLDEPTTSSTFSDADAGLPAPLLCSGVRPARSASGLDPRCRFRESDHGATRGRSGLHLRQAGAGRGGVRDRRRADRRIRRLGSSGPQKCGSGRLRRT